MLWVLHAPKWQQKIIRQEINVHVSSLLECAYMTHRESTGFLSATISWWDESQLIILFLPQGSRTKLGDASDSWKTGWGLTEQSCATATRMWVPGTAEWASTIIQTMVTRFSNMHVFPSVESSVKSNKCLTFFRSNEDLQTDTNNCSIVLKNFKQFHLKFHRVFSRLLLMLWTRIFFQIS